MQEIIRIDALSLLTMSPDPVHFARIKIRVISLKIESKYYL
jgi:hypothetical protein